ncbi:DUF2207 domain-containing protein [Kineococcus sp. SYSU DK005]|uniref:DUF2207 domain-containing protein n=1 Tax=Kineococcus sp. SYSU DK005 TaxID=3383126 RepID=UPI003D7C7B87
MSPALVRRAGAALALAAAVLAGPAAAAAAADEPGADERVRSYAVDLAVGADGSVGVRETLVYDFGDEGHHGLQRSIPVRGPHDASHDRLFPLSGLRVSSPSGAPARVSTEEDDGVLDVLVGDPDREDVRGQQTYVLEYRLGAVVDDVDDVDTPERQGERQGERGGQRVRVDVVGTGWRVPVERVEATLTAPGPLSALECSSGPPGSTDPCAVAPGEAPTTAVFSASDLGAGEGVTVGALLPPGTVTAPGPLLVGTFSPARAFTADALTLPASAAVLAAGAGAVLLSRRRRDGDGTATTAPPAAGAPPEGPQEGPPGALGALVHGGATGEDVVATLLDLAERGHLALDPQGEGGPGAADWRLERRAGADRTGPAEDRLLHTLFKDGPVTTLSALRSRSRAGVQLTQQLLDEEAVRRGWFRDRPSRLAHRRLGRALAGLALALALAVALLLWTRFALVGLALVAVALVVPFALRPRSPLTAQGLRARRAVEAFAAGLRRGADAPGAASAGGAALARHLPLAVALGATAQWAAAARALQASPEPVPRPAWYGGGRGAFDPAVFGGVIGIFSAEASGSLTAAPAAAPGTSSTSPAGSVGTGAGGGGGGSW